MTPTQVTSMVRRLEQRDVSLDTKVYDDAATTLGDTLPATDPDHADVLAADEVGDIVRDAVRLAVDDLDPRERYIVEHRMMADAEDELSLAEIGRRLGVSRERARQLEARAKKKLKSRITQLSRQSGTPLSELDTAA
jgi:RNA polymerase sigma-32 factor